MDRMGKSGENKVQAKVDQTESNMKYVTFVLFGLIFGLLAALVVFSVLIHCNIKDIKKAYTYMETTKNTKMSALNPSFEGLFLKRNKVEKNLTLHVVKTGESNKENIVIIGQEEIISTSNVTVIYDFSKGWVVAKLSKVVTHDCYVSQFDMVDDIEREREALLKIENDVYISNDETRIQYRRTDITISRALLSSIAAMMCENSRLIWFTEVVNNRQNIKRHKRGSSDLLQPYDFNYGVKDEFDGSNFYANEETDSERIQGSYQVLLPDGRVQTVTYTVDDGRK